MSSRKNSDENDGARSKLKKLRSFRENRAKVVGAAENSLVKNYFSEDSWLALLADLNKSDENLQPEESERLLDEDEKNMMSEMKDDALEDAVRMYGEESRRQSLTAQRARQNDWSSLIGRRVEYTGPPTELRESAV